MATGFPIKDVNFPSLQQLALEGRGIKVSTGPISTQIIAQTVNFGQSIGAIQYNVTPGRAFVVTSIEASATSGPVQFYSSSASIMKLFGGSVIGQIPSGLDVVFPTNGGAATINPLILIGSEGAFDVQCKSLMVNASIIPYISATIYGIDITADFNYSANKNILWIGESTSWGSMETDANNVAYAGEKLAPFVVTNYMRTNGKSVRLINKSFGSMSSNHMEYGRRSGFYDVKADLYVLNFGINDAAIPTTEATFKSNLANIITHRNTFNKNSPIIFVSCFPTDAYSGNIASYRTWMSDVANDTSVGGGTSNKVYYINGNNSFTLNATATLDTNFAKTNRVAGQRVHYSGEGQNLNAQLVISNMITYDWYSSF